MGIFSGITDALGLTDYRGAKRARESSEAYQAESNRLARENIAFQKEIYSDWRAVFGNIQTELGQYYSNLAPEDVIVEGRELIKKGSQKASTKVQEIYAQRGIGGGRAEASTLSNLAYQTELSEANLRANAEGIVAERQQGFLSLGLNNQSALSGGVNSAYQSGVNSNLNNANISNTTYRQLQAQYLNEIGGITGTVAGSLPEIITALRQT